MTHFTRDVLARYLNHGSPTAEREIVDWHLEHCPICADEITVKEILLAARAGRERLLMVAARGGKLSSCSQAEFS